MNERELIQRALNAWDSTPLPKASDGMMQEIMEDLRAALDAPMAPAEPITVEAVAEVRGTADGMALDWLIEGGIDAMVPGCVLVCATRPITDDDGQGEVYTKQVVAPVAPADRADPETDWPIARLRFDATSAAVEVVKTYTPGLPEGEHDVWCVPVAPADPVERAPINTVAERAAFEAHIAKDCGDLTAFGFGSNTHYRNRAVNNAWTGWIARAASASQAAPVAPALVPQPVGIIGRSAYSTSSGAGYKALTLYFTELHDAEQARLWAVSCGASPLPSEAGMAP